MPRFSLLLAALTVAALPALAQGASAPDGILTTTNIWSGVYTLKQAEQGAPLYAAACSDCHGQHLEGDPGDGFPALAGGVFMVEWDGQTMADLVRHIHSTLNDNPGDMDPVTAVALAAFILNQNGVPPGKTPLSTDPKEQAKILFTQEKPK